MISVVDLRKSYGSLVAIDGVNLEVPAGVCYGLLGPNGAGKSTTIAIIAGTIEADHGSVSVAGKPISTTNLNAKRRLGYVPQDLAIYEDLTARDNLRFFGLLYDIGGSDLERAIDSTLEIAGLRERGREPVRRFSGGMKRRLNIAVALLHNPDVLILDEPTVGIDPQSRNLIFDALDALVSQGKTILYTTHYMEEVERLCKSVAILDHGRVIADGPISKLVEALPGDKTVRIDCRDLWQISTAGLDPQWQPSLAGRRLTVTLSDMGGQLPEVIQRVRSVVDVESVETERPSLEEVFLHLTGRSLRD